METGMGYKQVLQKEDSDTAGDVLWAGDVLKPGDGAYRCTQTNTQKEGKTRLNHWWVSGEWN